MQTDDKKQSFWDKKPFDKTKSSEEEKMANTWGESVGPGDSVIYVPNHAFEDGKPNFNHPSCEYGIIKSAQSRYIFVNYVVNGIVQGTAKATDPRNLFLLNGESLFDLIEVFNKINEVH